MPSLSNIFSWSESQQFLLLLLLWAVEPRNRVNWCVLLQTPLKMCTWSQLLIECIVYYKLIAINGMAWHFGRTLHTASFCVLFVFVTSTGLPCLGSHLGVTLSCKERGRGGLGCMILWRPGWAFWGKHFQVSIWTPPFNICPQLWSRSTLYFSRVELFVDEH